MSQTVLSVRINSEDKSRFEQFCALTGMNVSVCVNMFVKAVLREQKLPFEIKADPFYNEANIAELKNRIADINCGKHIHEHDLIEVTDE